MPWRVSTTRPRTESGLTSAAQEKFDAFIAEVNQGTHPARAARIWDADYKRLFGDQYQIRLSRKKRATFSVDEDDELVTLLQVGGHT